MTQEKCGLLAALCTVPAEHDTLFVLAQVGSSADSQARPYGGERTV
jgi:hypothetical protein